MARGRLIALEGIDGSGTTTQAALLTQALGTSGLPVTATYEPSSGAVGQFLRVALRTSADPNRLNEATLALLFAADRLDHRQRVIEPALAAGHVVLCDRYLWSSYAYQASALPLAWVEQLNLRSPPADLNVYLDVSPAVARARRLARGGRPERFDDDGRQAACKEAYDRLATDPNSRCLRIDGEQPARDITAQIVSVIVSLQAGPASKVVGSHG